MISVIIPAYNSQKTIGNCIRALRAQTVKEYGLSETGNAPTMLKQMFEIIVVDDGSKDKTAETVKSFKMARFFQKDHKGPAAARNFGAKMSRGDILLFTDADCEPDKNWIAEMSAPFYSDKNVAGVSGTYRTRQKELIARFAQYEIEERHAKMAGQKSIDFIGTFSAGYRKKIFDEFGGFDTSFSTSAGEDPELSFRIAEKGYKMAFAPKAIVYHMHPDTIYKYLRQKFRNSCWRVSVYAKRKKTALKGHSYTPASALIEAAGAAGFLIALLSYSTLSNPPYYKFILEGTLLFTFIPSAPLIYAISRKDIAAGVFSPFIIILRAFATALGISLGLLRRLFK